VGFAGSPRAAMAAARAGVAVAFHLTIDAGISGFVRRLSVILCCGVYVLVCLGIMAGWGVVSRGTLFDGTWACRRMATWGSGYSPQQGPRVRLSRPTPRDNGYSPQQGPRVRRSILIPVAVLSTTHVSTSTVHLPTLHRAYATLTYSSKYLTTLQKPTQTTSYANT